ncbi:MAG: hypothetical protein ACE5D2_04500 [Fidelibacterota bacterium]
MADPLVNTWELKDFSGGNYLLVNVSQVAYFPWLEATGDLTLSEYDSGSLLEAVVMKHFSIYKTEDEVNIHVNYESPELGYEYEIQDYRPSLNRFDKSMMYKRVRDEYYPYIGGHFSYTYSMVDRSLTINQDTLYRQVYIDQNEFIDSTRVAVLSGTLNRQGTEIQAEEPYLFDEGFRDNGSLTLTLNEDGTGTMTNHDPFGGNYTRDIEWSASDTILTITECYDWDCFDNEYNYTLTDGELELAQHFSFCGGFPDCLREREREFGLEPNTLEDIWMETNLIFLIGTGTGIRPFMTDPGSNNDSMQRPWLSPTLPRFWR